MSARRGRVTADSNTCSSESGVDVLTCELLCQDPEGTSIDPASLGVDALVALIRQGPRNGSEADPELALACRVWGAARLALEAVDRLSRQVAALRAACVAAVGQEARDGPAGEPVLDELSCTLLVSRRSAQHTRATSMTVCGQPEVWAALARGEIDLTRARILSDALLDLPRWDADGAERPEHAHDRATLLAEGLPYAREHSARRLELFLQRRLMQLGVERRTRRRRRALAERGVWIAHDGEGTADLTARLSSEEAEQVYAAIRAVALADRAGEPGPDCPAPSEPMDAWMAAALVDLVLGPGGWSCDGGALDGLAGHAQRPGRSAASTGGDVRRRGVRLETVINVTIPIESLAGLDDAPGMVNGFGVLPAEVARRLAAGDARWRHLLTCRTSGALLDVGTLSYRPPPALARHVRLRDGTCRFPGCSVPARECDLDHLIPFPEGATSADNLHALCRRHHGLKHEDGWSVQSLPGHRLRWTSPQGAVATTSPDDSLAGVA